MDESWNSGTGILRWFPAGLLCLMPPFLYKYEKHCRKSSPHLSARIKSMPSGMELKEVSSFGVVRYYEGNEGLYRMRNGET